jgi:hypothetical protein
MARENVLDDRRRALEEEFFRKQDQKLRDQLRARHQQVDAKRALADASGVSNEEALERLIEHGISAETLAALTLVPMVEVAWADRKVDAREREAILRAAEEIGIHKDTVAHGMLQSWLNTQPKPQLRLAWEEYIKSLAKTLTDDERTRLEQGVIGRARSVAVAAGVILGLKKISAVEEATLAALAKAMRG